MAAAPRRREARASPVQVPDAEQQMAVRARASRAPDEMRTSRALHEMREVAARAPAAPHETRQVAARAQVSDWVSLAVPPQPTKARRLTQTAPVEGSAPPQVRWALSSEPSSEPSSRRAAAVSLAVAETAVTAQARARELSVRARQETFHASPRPAAEVLAARHGPGEAAVQEQAREKGPAPPRLRTRRRSPSRRRSRAASMSDGARSCADSRASR